jgi:WD40 repeat protein
MVYSHLNPKRTIVRFLDTNGKIVSTLDVGGSVWCADSWESNGELRFAIGTGHRQIYCITFSENGRNYVRWRAPGVVVSVSFEPDGDNLLYGTWQKSFLLRSTRRGTVRWSTAIDPAALPEIASLGDGAKWRVLIIPNRQGSDAQLRMMNEDCNQLWEEMVKAQDRSRVLVSNTGEHCCIGYEKQIVHSGKAIVENHAMLLDKNGEILWDKGTMFLHLTPLAVADDGSVLAYGSGGKLLIVDSNGNVTESETLGGEVVSSIWSPSTSRVLVDCNDGKIYMLGLNTVK